MKGEPIMLFRPELLFIQNAMRMAYSLFGNKCEKINDKGCFDLVTDLDVSIERYISLQIHEHYPKDSILGEELCQNSAIKGRTWTVDPIDGTVNLANRIPIYGIQCSLLEDEIPMLGVIFFPETDIMCYAEKGKGAYIHGRKINCSLNESLHHSVITMGDFSHSNNDRFIRQIQILQRLAPEVAKIRMVGAASYDFFLLATGSTCAHIMFSRNLWDIIPGLLISQEAGAVVTNLDGYPYSFRDDSLLIAANKPLSDQLLSLIL